jgi:excisionase family DNA binding protein
MKVANALPRYLTAAEAADLLRTSRKAIYVMVERRQLPGVCRIGRRVLISAAALLQFLADQQDAPSLREIQR